MDDSTETSLRALAFVKRFWPLLLIGAVVIAVAVLLILGYRPGPGLALSRLHTLSVTDLPAGAQVYIDGDPKRPQGGGTLAVALLPGSHTILASATGYYPFEAITDMPSTEATLRAFLIPATVPVTLIPKSEQGEVLKRINEYRLPSREHPLLLAGGCAAVFVSDNHVIADASLTAGCTPPAFLCIDNSCAPTEVFSPVAPLKSLIPYPGRDDGFLVSLGEDVFALGLDPREPRAFGSVLHGRSPFVVSLPSGVVAGRDGATFFSLAFPPLANTDAP